MSDEKKATTDQHTAWIDLTIILNDWRDRHGLGDAEMLNALETWIANQSIVIRAIAALPKEDS